MWTGRLAGARAPSTTVWSDVTTLPLELGRDVELGAGLPDRLPESGGGAEGEMLLGCRLVKTGDRTGDGPGTGPGDRTWDRGPDLGPDLGHPPWI